MARSRLARDGRARRRRGALRVRTSSPSGGRSSSACARPGSSRSRTSSTGRTEIAAVHAAHDGPRRRRGDRGRLPGRRPDRRPPRPRQGGLHRPRRRAAARSSCTPARDVLGEEALERLVGLDLGDIVGVEGTAFKTRRGELSLQATGWTLLAKSLRPPPDKFHGLEDTELRYRHRELDLIANPETRELFRKRGATIAAIREYLDSEGFVEVETPVLQPLYGGALARPFTTHHNALDRDLYLRIATELYLKRLHRRRDRPRLRARQGLPQRGRSRSSTTPSSRCSSGTRPTPTTTTPPTRLEKLVAQVAERGARDDQGRARRGRDRARAAVAAGDAARRDPRADRDRRARASDPRGARRGDGLRGEPRRGLGQARRRAALEGGRAAPDPADLRHRLPGRDVAVREAPPHRGGPGRALGGLRRRVRDRATRSPSSTTPTSSAAASSSRPRSCAAATRRRSRSTSPTCRRSSTGCRRPAASGSASTGW